MNRSKSQRAVIYCRISRDNAQLGLGVQRQEKECRDLCEREGYTVSQVIVDNDVSAYRGKRRPGWEAVVKLIRSGQVDVLVAWHQDRITRKTAELEGLIDLLDESDVAVRTVMSGLVDLTTPGGRLQARLLGAVAQHESDQKSERHKAKARELAAAGKVGGGGTRPYGFEQDRVSLRKNEADAIRWAVKQVNSGKTLYWLCRNMPTPTVTGAAWLPGVLKRSLISPRVAGLREHRGAVVGNAEWPAIVDRAEWELCRHLLQDPARRTSHGLQRYLLTGGIAVDHLGRRCIARPNSQKARCYVTMRDEIGPGVRILADEVDAMVRTYVKGFARFVLTHPHLPEETLATNDAYDRNGADEVEQIENELRELGELRGQGKISTQEWWAIREPLEQRRTDALANIRVPETGPSIDELLEISDNWDDMDIERQRILVSHFVDRVVIGPAKPGQNTFDPTRVSIIESKIVYPKKIISALTD